MKSLCPQWITIKHAIPVIFEVKCKLITRFLKPESWLSFFHFIYQWIRKSLFDKAFFPLMVVFVLFFCMTRREQGSERPWFCSVITSKPVNSGHELWPGFKPRSSHNKCLCPSIKQNVFVVIWHYGQGGLLKPTDGWIYALLCVGGSIRWRCRGEKGFNFKNFRSNPKYGSKKHKGVTLKVIPVVFILLLQVGIYWL